MTFTDPDKAARALQIMVDSPTAVRLATLFKAFSDPTRARIISALAATGLCVSDLTLLLGMHQSAVSHQLRTLRQMRLVRRERQGRQIYYFLDDEHVRDLLQQGLEHVRHIE